MFLTAILIQNTAGIHTIFTFLKNLPMWVPYLLFLATIHHVYADLLKKLGLSSMSFTRRERRLYLSRGKPLLVLN